MPVLRMFRDGGYFQVPPNENIRKPLVLLAERLTPDNQRSRKSNGWSEQRYTLTPPSMWRAYTRHMEGGIDIRHASTCLARTIIYYRTCLQNNPDRQISRRLFSCEMDYIAA